MAEHTSSIIVTSFNQPNALRLCLAGFAAQDYRGFDLIVADDGSDADIRGLAEEFAKGTPFEVKFVTHERSGGRKPRIQNLAVLQSRGEQLIFCDGDCVPFRGFVSAHRAHYRPDSFCTGGYTHLSVEESLALTPEDVAMGVHEKSLTPALRRRLGTVHLKNRIYLLLGKKDEPKMVGRNFSIDRGAFLKVNGMDETFNGLRKEDSDIRNRLRNAGCEGISLWDCAFVAHLDHGLDPRRSAVKTQWSPPSREFYLAGRKRVRAVRGIEELIAEEQSGAL